MSNDFQSGSRSTYRAKRKKTNIILNSLIVIVLALIFFVAYTIFLSGDDKAAPKKEDTKTTANQASEKEDKDTEKNDAAQETEAENDTEEKSTPDSEETSAPAQEDESQAVITEGDGTTNVLRTIENPAWKPVGTAQTGEHTPVYDETHVDWQEMLKAVSYATGLEESNMTLHWLGRNKTTGIGSFSIVSSKDNQQKYNVYLEWVDGGGWKPTKVEELSAIE